ncbi:MAG: hypothetical protein ACLQOO_27945 [Terriglobia bacterium]
MTDNSENLERARIDRLTESQDLRARSIRLREESARLLEESTRLLERVDQLWKVVKHRDQYRRAGTSVRDFLLWEDAT